MSTSGLNTPGAICNSLIEPLDRVAGAASGMMKRDKLGFLDSIRSPLNRGMGLISVSPDQGNGQSRTRTVHYLQRETESDVATSMPADCDSSNERGLLSTDVDVTLWAVHEQVLNEEYVQQICQGKSEFTLMLLNSSFNAINRKVNTQLVQVANANFGNHGESGSSATKTITLLDASNDEKISNAGLMEFLETDMSSGNKLATPPIVVGDGAIARASRQLQIACCNDNGIDLSQVAGDYYYFKDTTTNTTLGSDECIVYEAGALELLTFHRYRRDEDKPLFTSNGAWGSYREVGGDSQGLIVDPVTGMIYDMLVRYDSCSAEYYLRLSLSFDLFTLPSNMYKATDPMTGNNGLYSYKFESA